MALLRTVTEPAAVNLSSVSPSKTQPATLASAPFVGGRSSRGAPGTNVPRHGTGLPDAVGLPATGPAGGAATTSISSRESRPNSGWPADQQAVVRVERAR